MNAYYNNVGAVSWQEKAIGLDRPRQEDVVDSSSSSCVSTSSALVMLVVDGGDVDLGLASNDFGGVCTIAWIVPMEASSGKTRS